MMMMKTDLERAFEEFDADHPEVYLRLVSLARKAKARGHKRIGIAMLFEVARWELTLESSDGEFKLNNSYRAFYARAIMRNEPDLAGIFETRVQRHDPRRNPPWWAEPSEAGEQVRLL